MSFASKRRAATVRFAFSLASAFLVAGCSSRAPDAPDAPSSTSTAALPDIQLDAPSELTSWPWPKSQKEAPHKGVTHWTARARDNTSVHLIEFDFARNPALRFELYSQDEDDDKPFDNVVKFWPMGVGQATSKLNARFRAAKMGTVVAAWNGPFFGYYRSAPIPLETAFHLAPIVLRGETHFNTRNHRWTMGVQYIDNKPVFKVFHLPGRALLDREFDFASGTLQCLIKDGKALKTEPFPMGPNFRKQPVASTPSEVGHIPYFDHAKFSRASLAWSRDNSRLYLLLVREPNSDSEGASIDRLQKWQAQSGGWNVPDLQRFWVSMRKQGRVWNAINSDAGDVAQLAYLLPSHEYSLISPQGDNPPFEQRTFKPDFPNAPQGGSLSYFYVRDASAK